MKKTNQTDLDFDVINLDETAGWDKLEIESVLEEKEEVEYFDEEDGLEADETVYSEEENDAVFSEDEYLDEPALTGTNRLPYPYNDINPLIIPLNTFSVLST